MSIIIKDEYAPHYKSFLVERKSVVMKQIETLQHELQGLDEQIAIVSGVAVSVPLNDNNIAKLPDLPQGYRKNSTWLQKVSAILRIENSALTTRQVSDIIIKLEPELNSRVVVKSVSSILSVNSRGENAPFARDINDRGETTFFIKNNMNEI